MNEGKVWVIKKSISGEEIILCDVTGMPMYWESEKDAHEFLGFINFSKKELKKIKVKAIPLEDCKIKRSIIDYELKSIKN